jgi:hypothetical protein
MQSIKRIVNDIGRNFLGAKLSQANVAELCGVKYNTLMHMMHNPPIDEKTIVRRQMPMVEKTLVKIMSALKEENLSWAKHERPMLIKVIGNKVPPASEVLVLENSKPEPKNKKSGTKTLMVKAKELWNLTPFQFAMVLKVQRNELDPLMRMSEGKLAKAGYLEKVEFLLGFQNGGLEEIQDIENSGERAQVLERLLSSWGADKDGNIVVIEKKPRNDRDVPYYYVSGLVAELPEIVIKAYDSTLGPNRFLISPENALLLIGVNLHENLTNEEMAYKMANGF